MKPCPNGTGGTITGWKQNRRNWILTLTLGPDNSVFVCFAFGMRIQLRASFRCEEYDGFNKNSCNGLFIHLFGGFYFWGLIFFSDCFGVQQKIPLDLEVLGGRVWNWQKWPNPNRRNLTLEPSRQGSFGCSEAVWGSRECDLGIQNFPPWTFHAKL